MRTPIAAISVVPCVWLCGNIYFVPAGDDRRTSNDPYGGWFTYFAFDQRESALMFVSSMEGSLFRSTDTGRCWTRMAVEGGRHGPRRVRTHPRHPGTILAAAVLNAERAVILRVRTGSARNAAVSAPANMGVRWVNGAKSSPSAITVPRSVTKHAPRIA